MPENEGRFRVEVIADSSGKFVGNRLRFACRLDAEAYAKDLMWRWTAVREWRVVEDPIVRDGAGVPWKDKPEDDDIKF